MQTEQRQEVYSYIFTFLTPTNQTLGYVPHLHLIGTRHHSTAIDTAVSLPRVPQLVQPSSLSATLVGVAVTCVACTSLALGLPRASFSPQIQCLFQCIFKCYLSYYLNHHGKYILSSLCEDILVTSCRKCYNEILEACHILALEMPSMGEVELEQRVR